MIVLIETTARLLRLQISPLAYDGGIYRPDGYR